MSDCRGESLRLPELPSFLRLLHISEGDRDLLEEQRRDRMDELFELAAKYCPQLAILMLPIYFNVNEQLLSKVARFGK